MQEPDRNPSAPLGRLLRRLFCACILSLALYQFSENTADPDLWAHAMFGEQSLLTRQIQRTEVYSWTARGLPFINHEVLAEAIIGAAHLAGGGPGILLLKIVVGFLTLGLALRTGAEDLPWPKRAVAWAFAGLAVVEISYGFPPRPQIFTALALACEIWLLRRIHHGKPRWALALPVLFAVWINAHGGSLAGLGLLYVTAAASTVQSFWPRIFGARGAWLNVSPVSGKTALILWATSVASSVALLANPWGFALVRWIATAVLWPRPEIEEWNPAGLGWDHAVFFVLILLAIVAFAFSRCPRNLWEIALCAALAFQAIRTVRHTPLFCIAALALVPRHLADVLERFRDHFARLTDLFSSDRAKAALCAALGAGSVGILSLALILHKDHPFTMEAPRKQYPLAAVDFARRHELKGNLLVFFDWGELCLWELPDCAVSMDGRMDACYPHDLITEHWAFYNGQSVHPNILNLDAADLALLPANLAGAAALAKQPGWQAVYFDDVAVLLVRNPSRFPKLASEHLPVQGQPDATTGRDRFPDALPERVVRLREAQARQ
jgi:hypothetical protein